jgi:hypothetical protein|tara:strand:+ start:267 stop:455 length:189 start_codon:yes stop_codon:yes gene_type:complete
MIEALRELYKAQISVAKVKIDVYLKSPVGIGDHSNLVEAVDAQVEIMAEAEDKLAVLDKHNY